MFREAINAGSGSSDGFLAKSVTSAPPWLVSMLIHLVLLVSLAIATVEQAPKQQEVLLTSTEVLDEELEVPEEFVSSDIPSEELGADSIGGVAMAEAMAMHTSVVNDVPPPTLFPDVGDLFSDPLRDLPTANLLSQEVALRGATGVGVTGTMGAIDRITHEIVQSLEQREVLLVWLFDRSISMEMQRKEVVERMDRIYKELGVIEESGNEAFVRHQDKPLLSSVISFGQNVDVLTPKPTDSVEELRAAINSVTADESGLENIFGAINVALDRFKVFRNREPRRNVMLIAFTDEVGSDQHLLDSTVVKCRNLEVPVYVIGVPAPFGRAQTEIKFVNPDPQYEQVVQWATVDQGPETLYPELVRLASPGTQDDELVDSGYGPFALTRLCHESGGIYFAVHPNRERKPGSETALMASRLSRFFDPDVMQKYRPDYLPIKEVERRIASNKAKHALVTAAKLSGVGRLEAPRLRFPKTNEAQFVNSLTEGQKAAALLEPRINQLYEILRQGERDREKLADPRWQAGYDLAMGRVLAAKVRTEAYNLMLARGKQGMKFKDPKNDTWDLKPSDSVTVGSALEKLASQARTYLERVVEEHPDTPWAYYAKRELREDFGWEWQEMYLGINEPRVAANPGNNDPAPLSQDEQAQMLRRRPAPPPPPKL